MRKGLLILGAMLLLWTAPVLAEQMDQIRIVNDKGATLSVMSVPAGKKGDLRVTVTGRDGKPKNGVKVSLVEHQGGRVIQSQESKNLPGAVRPGAGETQPAEGAVLFSGVAPGTYRVEIDASDTIVAGAEILGTSAAAGAVAAGTAGGGAGAGAVAAGGTAAGGAAAGGAAATGVAGAGLATGASVGAGAAAAAGVGAAAIAGGAIAIENNNDDGGGEPGPTATPTVAPTATPTPRPPDPRPPRPPSAS